MRTQLTSRGRHHSMLQLRGAAWRFAGLCCRQRGAGCFMRGTTAASHHWTSADRGKHFGESSLSRIQLKTLNRREVCRIIPLVFCRFLVKLECFYFFLLRPSCWFIHCYPMFPFSRHQQLTMLLNQYINEPRDLKPKNSNSENFSEY